MTELGESAGLVALLAQKWLVFWAYSVSSVEGVERCELLHQDSLMAFSLSELMVEKMVLDILIGANQNGTQ